MYSEIIYTRCRQGIDIIKNGRPITSDGYKVYACTSSLLQDGKNDLQFLLNAAQTKQPYNEPSFMDDAYLYFVPEKGDSFLLNFYPVPFDPNAKGDYAHRAGNFVNHIIIGDYSEFYPFELFRDNAIWNAKAHGEAYYYENTPTDLPIRNDIKDPAGQFGIDEISAFVEDGRQEALMSAVSFLISQYELPPEERKFLVIRDESEHVIEMWIAAIECAFSPKIAASIPFATRMEKFTTTNRYTVNEAGLFQTQINLQDKNQKLRYRAMIVGVDERDRVNVSASRPLVNSPFVLLDGKEKKATFDADITDRYYSFITCFNDSHQSFCREFLQTINITAPFSDICRLLDVYQAFENEKLPNAKEMSKLLGCLGKFTLIPSSKSKNMYACVTADLQRFLQEDLYSALEIIKWLQSVSQIVGDKNASTRFTDIVCKCFVELVFSKSDFEGASNFWKNIKNSDFAVSAAKHFIDPSTLQTYQTYFQRFKVADKLAYVLMYLDCASFAGNAREGEIKSIVNWGMEQCYSRKDSESAEEILKELVKIRNVNIQNTLLSIAKDSERGYGEFIVMILIEYDASIIVSDTSMMPLLRKLSIHQLEYLYGTVLKYRVNKLKTPIELEQMIKLLEKIPELSSDDKAEIFELIDQKVDLNDKSDISLARTIQKKLPKGAICIRSAHIVALDILNDKKQRMRIREIYNKLALQGFPSIKNDSYISALISMLFRKKLEPKNLSYIIQLFSHKHEYVTELVTTILKSTSSKQNEEWNVLIQVALQKQDPDLINAIVSECAKLKQGEKALSRLSEMLIKQETRNYFEHIAQKSTEIIRSQKSRSGFKRFFAKKK